MTIAGGPAFRPYRRFRAKIYKQRELGLIETTLSLRSLLRQAYEGHGQRGYGSIYSL